MLRTAPRRCAPWLVAVALTVLAMAGPVRAASISYGDFGPVPPGVAFGNVTESSATDPVPLYGPPTAFAVGLDFDPTGFAATASGGAQDLTDGQLNVTLSAPADLGITGVSLFEAGAYTLAGSGAEATQVLAGAILRATVTQVNGVDVSPISLLPVNASVGFNLAGSPGIVQPWSLGLTLNIAGQLDASQRATQVEIVIDNQLLAFSETASTAFITKQDVRLDVAVVPEPGTAGLVLAALAGLAAAARRRS